MTKEELKEIRHEIGFTQKNIAAVLGMHKKAYQKMESGISPIPKYISNYSKCLDLLNKNMLFRRHIANINVDLKEEDE